MRRRHLSGSLEFVHHPDDSETITKSTLKLNVQTNSQDGSFHRTQNVMSLSGGELSFATMAFQMAMWPFITVPFRCMDEFDFFMDDKYRQQTINSLLSTCDEQPSSQFLFLTPQDMLSMLDNDNIYRHTSNLPKRHIFKMPNPRVN
ncbi:hypothetical protein T492DRAFT_627685 [Pavlovales sp. CCMP2436]|nr:hypothetical protein T492DRAFT_627685 [Pavlovales sp. CCMP2436]